MMSPGDLLEDVPIATCLGSCMASDLERAEATYIFIHDGAVIGHCGPYYLPGDRAAWDPDAQ